MKEKILEFIQKYNMLEKGDGIVVGLSGGADSVALFLVMLGLKEKYNLKINAVHIHHMIREDAADRDAEFCKKLCEKYDVPFYLFKKDITGLAKEKKLSVEEAGRIYRYECFNEVMNRNGLNKIAVAHHMDDLAETVIFNLVRGSGFNGVSGIKPVRGNIIRPLLSVRKEEIYAYISEMNETYVVDETNFENDYARNKIRNVVIKELEAINPSAVKHIADFAWDSAEIYDDIKSRADSIISDSVNSKVNEIKISVAELEKENEFVQSEAILNAISSVCGRKKDITRKHIESVRRLIDMESGKTVNLPYNLVARRSYENIIVEELAEGDSGIFERHIDIIKDNEFVQDTTYGIVSICLLEIASEDNIDEVLNSVDREYTKVIDYDKISNGLCLRYARENDKMSILVKDESGDSVKLGTKKLSRIFTNAKIDRNKRDEILILADGDEVIWAIGVRFSDKYKIDNLTKRVLIIKYSEKK